MPKPVLPRPPGEHIQTLNRVAQAIQADKPFPGDSRREVIRIISEAIRILQDEQLRRLGETP